LGWVELYRRGKRRVSEVCRSKSFKSTDFTCPEDVGISDNTSNIQIKPFKNILTKDNQAKRKTTKYSVETKQSLLHLLREPPNSKHAIAFLTSSLP